MKPYVGLGVRNRTLWEGYGLLGSYLRPLKGSDCVIEKALDFSEGYADKLCYEVEDRKRLRLLMEKEVREGKYTQAFFDDIDAAYKGAVRDIKTFWRTDLANASAEELVGYLDRFWEIYTTTLHPMVLAIYASDLQDAFEKELKQALGGAPSQLELIEHTALLLTPTRLTTVQKEEQLLVNIERGLESDRQAALERLAREYGWFHMEYIGEPKTPADYEELLRNRAGESGGLSPEERLADTVKRQQEFFRTHETSDFFRNLVFAMQEFLIVLDFSKADLIEGIWYARPLLEEFGRRTGLNSWIDVRFLTPDEARAHVLEGTMATEEDIRERKRRFTLILEDRVITPYFGKDAEAKVAEFVEPDVAENPDEFKGQTAYPGLVRGIASVVTNAASRDKFEQGQILVTVDTTTELTSIIKKSAAIVADQGGLLSHTAIVSREFKIPCLVRTLVGTKLVNDGDEIEVDATQGIVRVLRRA